MRLRAAVEFVTLLWAASSLLLAAPATAHDARPVSVFVKQAAIDRYSVEIRAPESVSSDNRPQLRLPPSCRRLRGREGAASPPGAAKFLIACAGSLEGARFAIDYPLYNPSLSTLFRLQVSGQPIRAQLLSPDQTAWEAPASPSKMRVFRDYLSLGVEHIFAGLDHLLFVVGLVIIARTGRRVLVAVSGFTLAHSLTLALSVLDLVQVPSAPVEAVIALSILFLASEIARPNRPSVAARYPAAVAAGFGLLHGFGFAGALRDAGLPPGEVATGLLGFNMGVEAGQLIVIGLFVAVSAVVRKFEGFRAAGANLTFRWNLAVSYLIGTAATFWLFSRLGSLV